MLLLSPDHVPVELERVSHGEQDKRCHRVADGDLSGGPRHHVVDAFVGVRHQEVRSDVVPHLEEKKRGVLHESERSFIRLCRRLNYAWTRRPWRRCQLLLIPDSHFFPLSLPRFPSCDSWENYDWTCLCFYPVTGSVPRQTKNPPERHYLYSLTFQRELERLNVPSLINILLPESFVRLQWRGLA